MANCQIVENIPLTPSEHKQPESSSTQMATRQWILIVCDARDATFDWAKAPGLAPPHSSENNGSQLTAPIGRDTFDANIWLSGRIV